MRDTRSDYAENALHTRHFEAGPACQFAREGGDTYTRTRQRTRSGTSRDGVSEVTDDARITQLLEQAQHGNPEAMDAVMEALYAELKRRAAACIRRRQGAPGSTTLQPTGLVNETYLRLIRQNATFANRDHFVAIATRVMFRVLLDYQRAADAAKRGGGQLRITLSGLHASDSATAAVSDLAAAIERLEAMDQRKAAIVKLRALWGFEMTEIAETLGVSLSTVERDWRFARSWLANELDRA